LILEASTTSDVMASTGTTRGGIGFNHMMTTLALHQGSSGLSRVSPISPFCPACMNILEVMEHASERSKKTWASQPVPLLRTTGAADAEAQCTSMSPPISSQVQMTSNAPSARMAWGGLSTPNCDHQSFTYFQRPKIRRHRQNLPHLENMMQQTLN
jgi:hypothetical protein